MGHVSLDITIKGSKGKKSIGGLLVDTGATYTVLPRDELQEVGAWGGGKVSMEFGDGRTKKADVYFIRLKALDREGPAIAVTFKGAKPVIGVQTLESLGLRVDPNKRRLEPTRPRGIAYFY